MPPASTSDDPTRAARLARLRGLHQYYRDALSSSFAFPDLGDVPRELAEWVARTDNVDTLQLAELLQQIPNTALPAEHDRALRLMLFAILQANACTDTNNRYRDHIVPERLADSVRGALGRILGLHRCYEYFVDAVQLLYRMNLLEDVDAFMADHPDLFAGDATLRAIAGFIETGCGDYAAGLAHLDPLVAGPGREGLPLVAALSHMTCVYRLGALPDWPLRFDALAAGPDRFARELALLPELRMLQPLPEGAGPVVFVACDDGYFAEHARHLACSLHATNGSPPALHLHLYSPGAATLAGIDTLRARLPGLAIGVSAEDGPLPVAHAPTYYATARFVRAHQVLERYRRDLCIVDADALFHRPWERLAQLAGPAAEVVLAAPRVAPFWEEVLAGFVYCRATPSGREFLGKAAAFVVSNLVEGRAIWFTDQVALSVCADRLGAHGEALRRLDSALLVDMAHGEDALCWAVTTQKTGHPRYDAARRELARRYGLD